MLNLVTMPIGMYQTNCYIISDEKNNCVIFDCDSSKEVQSYIKNKNLVPKSILLTHGHSDHINGVLELRDIYNCEVVATEKEKNLLLDPNLNLSSDMGGDISISCDKFVNNGDTLEYGDIKIEVLETPGHTSGSACYIIDNIVISGDTLFAGSCGRVDLPTGNWQELLISFRKLKNLYGNFNVFPGHGPSTTLEHERNTNPYMLKA